MTFDSEAEARSVQWLMAYTQDCPKCGSPIEKVSFISPQLRGASRRRAEPNWPPFFLSSPPQNGGCNHMSCKKCSYQYCWVCHSLWDSSHYMCKQRPVDDSDERYERTRVDPLTSKLAVIKSMKPCHLRLISLTHLYLPQRGYCASCGLELDLPPALPHQHPSQEGR